MRYQAVDSCQGTAQNIQQNTETSAVLKVTEEQESSRPYRDHQKIDPAGQEQPKKNIPPSPHSTNNLEHMQAVVPWDPGYILFSETSLKLLQGK